MKSVSTQPLLGRGLRPAVGAKPMVTAIETMTKSPVTVIEAMAMNDAYITAIDADILAQGAPGERDHRPDPR